MSARTAAYGGTFDPPHVGHREVIAGLKGTLKPDRIIVIPSATPPHKDTTASADQRLEMCRLAFSDLATEISPIEIDRMRTGRPSYSYDTILELTPLHPELTFVIGTDQLAALPAWHRFPAILGLCDWVVLERKPDGADQIRASLSNLEGSGLIRPSRGEFPTWSISGSERSLSLHPTPARALSSRQIREAIGRSGQAPQGLVPSLVERYLKVNRLYGSSGESNDERA